MCRKANRGSLKLSPLHKLAENASLTITLTAIEYNYQIFCHFLTRETIFVISICFLVHQPFSEKGSTRKGKNLIPAGSELSSLKVDPF